MKYILFIIVAFGFNKAIAQVQLIPQPLAVQYHEGAFTLPDPCTYATNLADSTALEMLRENNFFAQGPLHRIAFKKQAALNFQVIPPANWHREAKKLGADTLFDPGQEGYLLKIDPKKISIIAASEAGLFYGMMTLKQISANDNPQPTALPCLLIYDVPSFGVRAWQDDISRGPIPTMQTLREEIRTLAAYKLNYFTLYTENVFKYRSHPDLAPEDGISAEEIEQLTAFAKHYHVQLVGNQQSFGHMEKLLAKPAYSSLGERKYILSPGNDSTYLLLSELYREVAPAYSCPYFQINCDETYGLGEGQSKKLVDSIGLPAVYASHINRLYELLKPYHKHILMWADIAGNHPEIIPQLPKDIILIPWAYQAADTFDYLLEPMARSGHAFWVAPGISCWSVIFPDMYTAQRNIFNMIRDGKKYGATGVLNTSWDDDGSNLFMNNWEGLVWGADLSWRAPDTTAHGARSTYEKDIRWINFNLAFEKLFWGAPPNTMSMIVNGYSGLHQGQLSGLMKQQKLFEPIFPVAPAISNEQRQFYAEALNWLNTVQANLIETTSSLGNHIDNVAYLQLAIEQSLFILQKNAFKTKISDYLYRNINAGNLRDDLDKLLQKLDQVSYTYNELYRRENREWWLQENIDRFENLKKGLEQLPSVCIIIPDSAVYHKQRMITLKSLFYDLPIYYTTDGTVPNAASTHYTGPFYVDKTTNIKATVFWGEHWTYTQDSLVMHKAVGKLKELKSTYSVTQPSFDGGGRLGLVDGRVGSAANLKSGRWQGYWAQDLELVLDFEKKQKFKKFSMGFYQNTPVWVVLPKAVEIYVSKDGVNYTLSETITHNISENSDEKIKHVFTAKLRKTKGRYMKIIARKYGKLPTWHAAAGNESMLFADEVIVE